MDGVRVRVRVRYAREMRAYAVLLELAGGPACESFEQPLADVLYFALVDCEVVLW